MIWGKKICVMLLLYLLTPKQSKSSKSLKNDFLFKNLAIDKKKLDSSYFYNYDNLQWEGKIIAIGDIHGDMESLKLILRHSNLINKKDEWVGENILLIQVGDILDRGIYGPLIYNYLFKLQKEAINKQSRIILILGNHEELNLCGYFNYVNKKEVELFFQNNYHYRYKSFTNKNGEFFQKLIKLPAIIKVNDIIFTHGGISKNISQLNINTISLKTRLQIENKCNLLKYDKSNNYLNQDGVLWNDNISRKVWINQKEACSDLLDILKRYNAKYLVVGHTKQMSHYVSTFCNHKFFLIDTCMSLFMNNGQHYPNYLLIENGKFKSVHLIVEEEIKKKKCELTKIHLYTPHNKTFCVQAKQIEFLPIHKQF
ncbi:shewanella-like protein phosphatase 1, putative [Plasmodium malariae]|uniref:Shewanella-like protein phosphatase 1, putative n=2 Tax=Plasmodium (Plasmodium) TaxID=418103 RepID=A0A1A8W5S7_PLAMA|nr:shewanella-like protein phosphatase 1, putative [Plasmodium malariae]SBS88317.1 shewanella-like protein phosphatase 1, putative (SHLP1) [Plasmodium malariae]SCO93880.1 shewanella-like protein phosphatase 1, putative [Plasmodium malariae]